MATSIPPRSPDDPPGFLASPKAQADWLAARIATMAPPPPAQAVAEPEAPPETIKLLRVFARLCGIAARGEGEDRDAAVIRERLLYLAPEALTVLRELVMDTATPARWRVAAAVALVEAERASRPGEKN